MPKIFITRFGYLSSTGGCRLFRQRYDSGTTIAEEVAEKIAADWMVEEFSDMFTNKK